MARFTFLEVHLDGAEFTANAPFSSAEIPDDGSDLDALSLGTGGEESSEGESPAETAEGRGALPVVFSVLALALVAAVVLRRLLGGSGEPVLEE